MEEKYHQGNIAGKICHLTQKLKNQKIQIKHDSF